MKPFKFKLEALVTLKEAAKEKALEAYADALQRRAREQESYDSITETIKVVSDQVGQERKATFTGPEQAKHAKHIQELNRNLRNAFELLMKAHEVESERLKELIICKGELEVLLQLKEKQKNAHVAHEALKEEKAIEDLVTARTTQTL